MKISFIIVNYQSEKYIKKCILSILKKVKDLEVEIIVVNNDKRRIENLFKKDSCFNKIIIIEINQNIGFGKANNRGAIKSSGDILCFINPDAMIISNDIVNLINEFKNNNIGIIGPKILKNQKVQSWSAGVDMNIGEIIKGKLGFPKSKKIWLSDKKIKTDWVSGVSLFIKKDLFLSIGGFDEKFFLYYEDVDLCKRVRRIKKEILYFPLFKVNHLEGKSSKNKFKQKSEYFKSQDYYYKKWFNFSTRYLLKFLRFFYMLRYKIKPN